MRADCPPSFPAGHSLQRPAERNPRRAACSYAAQATPPARCPRSGTAAPAASSSISPCPSGARDPPYRSPQTPRPALPLPAPTQHRSMTQRRTTRTTQVPDDRGEPLHRIGLPHAPRGPLLRRAPRRLPRRARAHRLRSPRRRLRRRRVGRRRRQLQQPRHTRKCTRRGVRGVRGARRGVRRGLRPRQAHKVAPVPRDRHRVRPRRGPPRPSPGPPTDPQQTPQMPPAASSSHHPQTHQPAPAQRQEGGGTGRLLELARGGRVLLTRDKKLMARREPVAAVYVEDPDPRRQLAQARVFSWLDFLFFPLARLLGLSACVQGGDSVGPATRLVSTGAVFFHRQFFAALCYFPNR